MKKQPAHNVVDLLALEILDIHTVKTMLKLKLSFGTQMETGFLAKQYQIK